MLNYQNEEVAPANQNNNPLNYDEIQMPSYYELNQSSEI